MPLGTEVGLGPSDVVLDGDPPLSTKRGTAAPHFGPCLLWPNGRPSQQLLGSCKVLAYTTLGIDWLPAALRAAQTCRYLVYSEADFEVFRPAGATCCTDAGEIWHGGGDPPPCQISSPSVQRQGCRTPKIEIVTQI